MADKYLQGIKSSSGDNIRFIPPPPSGERLGGINETERTRISNLGDMKFGYDDNGNGGYYKQDDETLTLFGTGTGGGGFPQVDYTDSTETSFALDANTLYLLPNISSEVSITLTQPETGVAKLWYFVVNTGTGSISFSDQQVTMRDAVLLPNSKYLVTVVDSYAYATMLTRSEKIYLINSTASDALCQDITGGWYLNETGLRYRNTTAYQNTNGTVFVGWTSNQNSYACSNIATKAKINAKHLLDQGYSSIVMRYTKSMSSDARRLYLIASGTLASVTNTSTETNHAQAYGTHIDALKNFSESGETITMRLDSIVSAGLNECYISVLLATEGTSNTNILETNVIVSGLWIE